MYGTNFFCRNSERRKQISLKFLKNSTAICSTDTILKVNNEEPQKKTCPVKTVRKADGSKILWELQSHQSGFWNSWRILGVEGCDKNFDQKIRWFCLSEKNVLKWMKLILQYWLKKILLQPLKVRFFKEFTRKKN